MYILYLVSKFIKKLHIPAIKNSKIDKTAKVCSGTHLVDVKIGKYSYIGNCCVVINTKIGNYCSIADNCIIGGASHPMDRVSTSPVFHKGKNILKKNFSEHALKAGKITQIANDVWLGNNCLIKSGITIGNGAIIGMGSVVTKNIGPYEIWAGNPARLIRKRFDEKIIKQLLESKWWEYEDCVLEKKVKYFNEPEMYLKSLEN